VTIYGLRGVTHGAGRVLTLMSPEGASAVTSHVSAGDDVIADTGAGQLPRYREKRAGALDRLIEAYGVQVLSKADWDRKKEALGEAIWR